MANLNYEERQRLFNDVVKSWKDYSAENILDPETVKSEIIKLFETHRPVKICDFEFGFNQALKPNHRLIIKNEIDPTKVREYLKNEKRWQCINYFSRRGRCRSSDLEFKCGILFAPINHGEIVCKTRDYYIVNHNQKLLKQKNEDETAGSAKDAPFSENNRSERHSSQPLSASILNESTLSTSDAENEESINDDKSGILSQSPQPSSSRVAPSGSSIRTSVKTELNVNNTVLDEPSAKKPKLENDSTEKFTFDHPSASGIKQICQKLEIEYHHDAYKFWADIVFDKIPTTSKNIVVHILKSSNIFACLSLFFTGKIVKCYSIQEIIMSAYRDELIAEGTMSLYDIDQAFLNSTVSDEHLQFISKFLKCRIGIYENGKLKKFGDWNIQENITLVLSFVDGKYSVVHDL